jgi:hypothetical protein
MTAAVAADETDSDPRERLAIAMRDGERTYERGMRTATLGLALAPAGLGVITIGGLLVASGSGRNEAVSFAGIGLATTGVLAFGAMPAVVSVGLARARLGLRQRGLEAPSLAAWLPLGLLAGGLVGTIAVAATATPGAAIVPLGLFVASYVAAGAGYSHTIALHHGNTLAWMPLVAPGRLGMAASF